RAHQQCVVRLYFSTRVFDRNALDVHSPPTRGEFTWIQPIEIFGNETGGRRLSLYSCAMMITRRDAVASFALFAELVASSHLAEAQTQTAPASPPAAPRPPVFIHDLPNLTMDG